MIRVGSPHFAGREIEYVQDVLSREQLSMERYVRMFEELLAEKTGKHHALACCNGTAALHLTVLGLGLRPGEEVLVPATTYVATANAVAYCGAKPIFVDVDPVTWNIDPHHAQELINEKTVGIITVHLYGLPADTRALRKLCDRNDLWLVEDAAEAIGATFEDGPIGRFGNATTFSFFGNKTISCGEGGAVVTDDKTLHHRMAHLRGQGVDSTRRYWHTSIGYNYRLTDLQAAVAFAQLETLDWHVEKRREIASAYHRELNTLLSFQGVPADRTHSYWMFAGLVEGDRDEIIRHLAALGVESRPTFPLIPWFPMYSAIGSWPVAEHIAKQGLVLPTHAKLTMNELVYVCESVKAAVEHHAPTR